jgi:hypothetical protein
LAGSLIFRYLTVTRNQPGTFAMNCSIRYYRPGRREDAGLLIATKAEFAIYKARLEAAGYVVLENVDMSPPTLEIPVTS